MNQKTGLKAIILTAIPAKFIVAIMDFSVLCILEGYLKRMGKIPPPILQKTVFS